MLDRIRGKIRVLFVCTQNKLRSKTAEMLFSGHAAYSVRSAGTGHDAPVKVSAKLLRWADRILVMEQQHVDHLEAHFAEALRGKVVDCLEIPDEFDYMQPELCAILERKVAAVLGPPPGTR
jgi:predicted protein tyrosine phosphatase